MWTRARAHGAAPFVSDAEAMPIYVWPPAAFWAIVGRGVAAAALGRRRRARPLARRGAT